VPDAPSPSLFLFPPSKTLSPHHAVAARVEPRPPPHGRVRPAMPLLLLLTAGLVLAAGNVPKDLPGALPKTHQSGEGGGGRGELCDSHNIA